MTESVVVTGAHSYIGRRVVRHLAAEVGFDVVAVVTPWADREGLEPAGPQVSVHAADLTGELPEALRAACAGARYVLHLAWRRGPDGDAVTRRNLRMLDGLLAAMPEPRRLGFVSSAAAALDTRSNYGRGKWTAARHVRERGGTVLVCGLVVEEVAQGPYRLLENAIRRVPVALRLEGAAAVYPVAMDELLGGIEAVVRDPPPSGAYRLFGEPVAFNRFVAALEDRHRRPRLPVTLDAGRLLRIVGSGARLRVVSARLAEKLFSFLYKDEAYLRGLRSLPAPEAAAPAADPPRPLAGEARS